MLRYINKQFCFKFPVGNLVSLFLLKPPVLLTLPNKAIALCFQSLQHPAHFHKGKIQFHLPLGALHEALSTILTIRTPKGDYPQSPPTLHTNERTQCQVGTSPRAPQHTSEVSTLVYTSPLGLQDNDNTPRHKF